MNKQRDKRDRDGNTVLWNLLKSEHLCKVEEIGENLKDLWVDRLNEEDKGEKYKVLIDELEKKNPDLVK